MLRPPIGLDFFPILGKSCTLHVGEGPRTGQKWKKKLDSWPKVNKDPEEQPHINDLTTSSLSPSSIRGGGGGDAHTLCIQVYLSALLLS